MLQKYQAPTFSKSVLDDKNKAIPDDKLKTHEENGQLVYSNDDGKKYLKDSNGFYYMENNEKIRMDEKGNKYVVKQNFAYKINDNSLKIGA